MIFRRNDERANHLIAIIGLAVFGFTLIRPMTLRAATPADPFRYLTEVLVLNTIHVVFTFAMLICVPQMRTWIERRWNLDQSRFWLAVMGGFVFFTALFYSLTAAFQNRFQVEPWILPFILSLGPLFHALWQIRGLSTMYVSKPGAILNGGRRPAIHFRSYRLLFGLLVMSGAFRSLGDSVTTMFHTSFSQMGVAVIAITYLVILRIMLDAYRTSGLSGGRVLYLTRLFIFPFYYYNPTVFFLTSIFHGVEYFFVIRRISKLSLVSSAPFIVVSIVLTVFVGAIWFGALHLTPGPLLVLVSAFLTSITYVHYVLDRHLFRMRDPETRALIGPLLRDVV